ncbi:MAG TPA: LysR substrate-binding domain-containing protein [Mesorhizobium sp.]|nr:LysR substrate-binding domain-containing protein [Mesorhizobium sp.]
MKLPPIAAIRAFEAAARYQSFTRAAEELGMTQAAVSYQIKLLEDRIGVPLFVREPRQVTLTAAGRKLSPKVTEALDLLGSAFVEVARKPDLHLIISTLPTVASTWLVPRLPSFQAANPEVRIKLHTSNDSIDFAREDIDVMIRGSDSVLPEHEVFSLFPMEYAPVCTAEYRERHAIAQPADLLKVRRFGALSWWAHWLTGAGVENGNDDSRMDLVIGVQSIDVGLTLQGQGVAMVMPIFFADELSSGRLIRPFRHSGRDNRSYSLVYPKSRRHSRKIRLVREWIIAEAEATRSAFATIPV